MIETFCLIRNRMQNMITLYDKKEQNNEYVDSGQFLTRDKEFINNTKHVPQYNAAKVKHRIINFMINMLIRFM